MDDFDNQFIINTEKILNKLNELDNKFSLLDDELLNLKWEFDDIKKSISHIAKPCDSDTKHSSEVIKPKQIQSKTNSITKK